MAKTVRDAKLDSKEARAKLKARPKPYYRDLAEGLHIGYRKGARGGSWVVRRYIGDERYKVDTIAAADDQQDADGDGILNFRQAQEKARNVAKDAAEQKRIADAGPPITVESAIEEYLKGREARESKEKGDVALKRDARSRLTRHLLGDPKRKIAGHPDLAKKSLHELTADDLSKWRAAMVERMAENTVRRTVNDLKAALNAAAARHRSRLPAVLTVEIKSGLAPTAPAPVVAREAQVLADADVRRILQAAKEVDGEHDWSGDLLRLVAVLAATGARFSQAVRMAVADVQVPQKRLMIPVSRKGRGEKAVKRTAVRVGEDVLEILRPALAGRKGPDALFRRPRWEQQAVGVWKQVSREPWQSASELTRPWKMITEKAELPADIVPYALRHSSIVRGLGAGLPVRLVAALHDTSSAMIEKHYAAYIVDAMDELAARAVVPLLPAEPARLREVI